MKPRKKALLSAAAVTALFAMGGCGDNEVPNVYGPAPFDDTQSTVSSTTPYDPADNENATVYGPAPDYAPEDNQNQDVYGPPPEDIDEPVVFDPSENMTPDVYGPPEWFEGKGEHAEDISEVTE